MASRPTEEFSAATGTVYRRLGSAELPVGDSGFYIDIPGGHRDKSGEVVKEVSISTRVLADFKKAHKGRDLADKDEVTFTVYLTSGVAQASQLRLVKKD